MRPTSAPVPQASNLAPYFPVKQISYPGNQTMQTSAPTKANRPPKPVNTFLIFCRLNEIVFACIIMDLFKLDIGNGERNL
jgi:hypothetical protein